MAKKKKPMRIPVEQRQLSYRIGLFSEICLPAHTAMPDNPPAVLNPLHCSSPMFLHRVYASLLVCRSWQSMPSGIVTASMMCHSL